MQIRSKLAISLFSLLGVVACGDDDSGGTGGVSGNTKIGDLSDAEAKKVCNGIKSKLAKMGEAQLDLICNSQGIFLSNGNASTCEMSADMCREAGTSSDFDIDCEGTDGKAGGVPEGCDDVTVKDLTACMDATVSLLESVVDKVTCSTPISELTNAMTSIKTPEQCSKLGSKCGDFLAADGT